jgi:hypothetical protein
VRRRASTVVSTTMPACFGQATATRDARQMQRGEKLVW